MINLLLLALTKSPSISLEHVYHRLGHQTCISGLEPAESSIRGTDVLFGTAGQHQAGREMTWE